MEKLDDVKLLRNGIRRQLILPTMRDTLRDKQVEAFEALISPDFTDEQISHSYFKLPTGFGKTVMFSHMARAYFDAIRATNAKRQKIIIIVPRLSLIEQTQQKLARFADITATEFSGRTKDANSDVIITTYNSLTKLFGVVDFNDVGLIFADEAHHMLGSKISEKLEFYNKFVPVIGFTATPEYEANRAVANLLNTEIYAMDIQEGINGGVLSPVKNILYRSSAVCDLSTVPSRTNGEFDYDEIKISYDSVATEIARIYAEGADEDTGTEFKNLKAIINCPTTKIAEIQTAKINEIMGRDVAVALHKVGISDAKFKRLQQDFIAGKYSVACQVGTMTEGFDDPAVSMCINYPTRSHVKEEQTAGRTIRIDENNPDKIAFVIDTIFRATPNDKLDDILGVASRSQQVLFKDVIGTMVVFREHTGKSRKHNRRNVNFVDFDLITNSGQLMALYSHEQERTASEAIGEKTDEWQNAYELAADKTFPMNTPATIRTKLIQFQSQIPEFIQVRRMQGKDSVCLHSDGRERFLKLVGTSKTDEWQTIRDLVTDKTFKCGNRNAIKKALEDYQHEHPEWVKMRRSQRGGVYLYLHRDGREWLLNKLKKVQVPKKTAKWQSADDLKRDKTFYNNDYEAITKALEDHQYEHPEWVQLRKPKGAPVLCLHRNGRQWLLEKIKANILPKTGEWQSADELARDKKFDNNDRKAIKKALEEYQYEHPEWIQVRKSRSGTPILCLHRDGRAWFSGKIDAGILPKTDEWQSALDLEQDKTFNYNNRKAITKALEDYQHEHPEWIQMKKSRSRVSLCLHRAGREWLLDKLSEKYGFPKTDEWQSALDLKKDKTFNCDNLNAIKKALEDYQHEHPEWVQVKKPNNSGPAGLCLHRKGREWLLSKLEENTPPKTNEWQGINDLIHDKTFDSSDWKAIKKALEDYQYEHPEWVQVRKPRKGVPILCLHRDGRQWLLERIEQEKQTKKKSLQRAATVLDAGANVIDTAATIKSTTTDKTKKK